VDHRIPFRHSPSFLHFRPNNSSSGRVPEYENPGRDCDNRFKFSKLSDRVGEKADEAGEGETGDDDGASEGARRIEACLIEATAAQNVE
jgi:hypothetical protein